MKTRIIICIFLTLVCFPGTGQPVNNRGTDSLYVDTRELAEKIIDEARKYLGRPYRWAANGPDQFDCSGFTQYVFGRFGIKLGRTSKAQAREGRPVTGSFLDFQKGDLLIFGGRYNKKAFGHTGIFISCDSTGSNFSFIHAARTGVIVSEYNETYYMERFLGAVRVLPDYDPLPVKPDTLAWNIPADVILPLDTLHLGVNDKRIVLFENGSWAFIDESGAVYTPENENKVIRLYGDGRWYSVVNDSVRIPLLSEAEESSPTTVSRSEERTAQYHTIRQGDTLSGIAAKYHTNVRIICQLNGISQNMVLKIGKKIRVK